MTFLPVRAVVVVVVVVMGWGALHRIHHMDSNLLSILLHVYDSLNWHIVLYIYVM